MCCTRLQLYCNEEPHLLGVGLVWPHLFIGSPHVFYCEKVVFYQESSRFLFRVFFSLFGLPSFILVLRQLFSFLSELLQELVSPIEMIDLQQYRVALGCFVSFHASLSKSCEYVRVESKNVISVCRHSVHFTILLTFCVSYCCWVGILRLTRGPQLESVPNVLH